MIEFVPTKKLTGEQKYQAALMSGKIVLYILYGRSLSYMAERLKMDEKAVLSNISNLAWILNEFLAANWR